MCFFIGGNSALATGEAKAVQGPAIVEGKQEDANTTNAEKLTKSPKKMSKNTRSKSRAASTRRKLTTPGSPTKKISENTKTQSNNNNTITNNNNDITNDKDTTKPTTQTQSNMNENREIEKY